MADSDSSDPGLEDNNLGRREFLRRFGLLTAAPWLAAAALGLGAPNARSVTPAPAADAGSQELARALARQL